MATGFVWHERYMWHDNGSAVAIQPTRGDFEPLPHFESPDTKRRLKNLMDGYGVTPRLERLAIEPAGPEDVLRVHTREYLERVQELSAGRGGDAGEYALVGPGSYEIALLSAGGARAALAAVAEGRVANAYALTRPPGHHAVPEHGMGFCLFSNIGVAVKALRAAGVLGRVAVVDWDVHHGNGTQAVFWDEPEVLTISLHQENLYPIGSGAIEETGAGEGAGFNLNVPLPSGSGGGAYEAAVARIVVPALERFAPELVVIACGLDANMLDPLSNTMLSSAHFRAMTEQVMQVAGAVCGGRVAAVHEGGYSAAYVPFCGLAVIEALSGIESGVVDPIREWIEATGGQALQPHQEAAIAAAERHFAKASPLFANGR